MKKNDPVRCGNPGFVKSFLGGFLALTVAAGAAWGQTTAGDPPTQKSAKSMALGGPGGFRWERKGPNPVKVLLGTPEEKAWIRMTVRDMPVTFLADKIAQETATDIITATGNVTIVSGTSTVECHTMIYDPETQSGRFYGEPGVPRGVRLTQKGETGDQNYYETDWMIVTFGDGGIQEIETGPGQGEFMLPGEEPLPIGPVEPATGEKPKRPSEGLPRSIAPPPIDE